MGTPVQELTGSRTDLSSSPNLAVCCGTLITEFHKVPDSLLLKWGQWKSWAVVGVRGRVRVRSGVTMRVEQ